MVTADDPLTGAEILHWLNSGAPDGWSWPLGMSPWELNGKLAAAMVAVLDSHRPWLTEEHKPLPHTCIGCGQDLPCPTLRVIATALGVDT